MGDSRAESIHSLEPIALKLLRKLMDPVKVKGLVFTSCGKRTVRGVVLTRSPTERREVARNFEVDLDENNPNSIRRVSVDGRRLFPKRTMRMHQKAVSIIPLRAA